MIKHAGNLPVIQDFSTYLLRYCKFSCNLNSKRGCLETGFFSQFLINLGNISKLLKTWIAGYLFAIYKGPDNGIGIGHDSYDKINGLFVCLQTKT